jgi:hypothetical protein
MTFVPRLQMLIPEAIKMNFILLKQKHLILLHQREYRYYGYNVENYHMSISACSRSTFYWKELRSCNMALNVCLLPAQFIGYLSFLWGLFFFDFFKKYFLRFFYFKIIRNKTHKE